MQHRRTLFVFILLLVLMAPAAIVPVLAADETGPAAPGGIFDLMPADSVTEHLLPHPGQPLPYRATAGTLSLYGPDGKVSARIFYTAYVAREGAGSRPVTFAFNGGPGAASAYLHLGLVGPKVLDFGDKVPDGVSPVLKDNPDSWLDFTDLVLIDPVGTGWSRAASDDAASRYYGVRQDAESLAKFIALYVQKNGRMEAPKYLLGESYGGFRAAKVATALKSSQGMLVSGIVMVSPMIEASLIFAADDDPLAAALQLPSLSAAHLARQGRFSAATLAEAERFAMGDYLVGLAGAEPEGAEAEAFYGRIAALTGIDKTRISASRGFVGAFYGKAMAARSGEIVSIYDAAFTAPDAYPESSYNRNDDPILDGFTRAYGGFFAAYARSALGYASDMTYALLNTEVNQRWDWGDDTRTGASAADDLRDLLGSIPRFRLLVMHGTSDAITPYGASRYVLDHLPRALKGDRTRLTLYPGGHMFYADAAARRQASADARAFYAKGLDNQPPAQVQ